MRISHAVFMATCLAASPGPARADGPSPEGGRKFLLERVDDAAVIQLYADGFTDLPLSRKMLVWHLYQASVAGRDIYYDQRYAHGVIMRGFLETVVAHPAGVDADTLAEVKRYTKLFWMNSGPYNHLTARKFVLKCTPEAFDAAFTRAFDNDNAAAPRGEEARRDALRTLAGLRRDFFDPTFLPIVTNKSPAPGKDILLTSANNLYSGVAMSDLAGFTERHGLNSRLSKTRDGALAEGVYRVGGVYDKEISAIVGHLKEAKKFAPEPTAKALDALIRWYTTGEDDDRRAYDIAWVQDKDATVDTINGFIEVYLDARGVKGSWESAVSFVNMKKTGAIKKIAAEAQWFEDRMPWEKAYRKASVVGITANAIDVVIETGDCGPVTPIGINLPNDQKVREQYGSKSVSLSNVVEASDKAQPSSLRKEFSWEAEEADRTEKWGTLASELLVNMHEVIGHASGKLGPTIKGQPQEALKQYYSALEEGRADLVALYFMPNPKLAALGLVAAENQRELARTAYEQYSRNVLAQLRRVRDGDQIEEDHMRNRQMVVRWLIANTKAVEVRMRSGKTYYVVADVNAFHEGVGTLLAEVQRIKSEGDFDAAKALFETYGIRFDPKLRDEVVARVKALDLPSYSAFVMPRLSPVKNASGAITDVAISYPMDLTTQMLEFSGRRREP